MEILLQNVVQCLTYNILNKQKLGKQAPTLMEMMKRINLSNKNQQVMVPFPSHRTHDPYWLPQLATFIQQDGSICNLQCHIETEHQSHIISYATICKQMALQITTPSIQNGPTSLGTPHQPLMHKLQILLYSNMIVIWTTSVNTKSSKSISFPFVTYTALTKIRFAYTSGEVIYPIDDYYY